MSIAETKPNPQPGGGLFRSSAVERISSPERLDMTAAIVRPTAWLLLLAALVLVATALAAGILIEIPIKVEAGGILLNAAGVKEVVATDSGQIRTLRAHVGDKIKFGDVVAELEQPDLRQQVDTATAEAKEAHDQLAKVTAFQNKTAAVQDAYRAQQRQTLSASVNFAQQRVGWITEQMHNFEDLAAKGIITKQKLLDSRVEFGQANEELSRDRNALKQLDVDEDNQRNDRERERLALELKATTADRQLAQLNERMSRLDVVTSTYTGTIAELKVNEGEVVERGTALLTVIPEETAADGDKAPFVAVIFVQPTDGKKIRPGMVAEVLPATVKREDSGFIVGQVSFVSEVPATQEGMVRELKNRQLVQTLSAEGAPFEVRAELKPNPVTPTGLQWSTSRGPEAKITDGTPCRIEIVTRSEPALQLLIPATRPLFEMLRR